MPEPIRFKALLAKIETTYGTDASPTAASDEIQVEENFWSEITVQHLEENQRDAAKAGFGRVGGEGVPATGQWAEFEVVVPLKGRSAAFASDNVPEADVLWRIAAFEQDVDATVGTELVTYTLRETGFESASIYAYGGGKEYKLVGCFATVRVDLTPGQIAVARFTIRGLVDGISEAGVPAGLAFPSAGVQPITVKAASLTLDGDAPDDFQSFELDTQLSISERPGGNATDGHAGYWPSDWDPQISTAFEVFALGTHDPYTKRSVGTEFAWSIGPIGPAQYNKIKVSGPAGRYIAVDHTDINELAQYDTTIECRNTDATTADAVEIQYS